jgi:hypothetical protein
MVRGDWIDMAFTIYEIIRFAFGVVWEKHSHA